MRGAARGMHGVSGVCAAVRVQSVACAAPNPREAEGGRIPPSQLQPAHPTAAAVAAKHRIPQRAP